MPSLHNIYKDVTQEKHLIVSLRTHSSPGHFYSAALEGFIPEITVHPDGDVQISKGSVPFDVHRPLSMSKFIESPIHDVFEVLRYTSGESGERHLLRITFYFWSDATAPILESIQSDVLGKKFPKPDKQMSDRQPFDAMKSSVRSSIALIMHHLSEFDESRWRDFVRTLQSQYLLDDVHSNSILIAEGNKTFRYSMQYLRTFLLQVDSSDVEINWQNLIESIRDQKQEHGS